MIIKSNIINGGDSKMFVNVLYQDDKFQNTAMVTEGKMF